MIIVMSVVFALMSVSRARAIRADSAQAQAVIARRIVQTNGEFAYVYKFSVDGRRYQGDWYAHEDGRHSPGDVIVISYRRSDPIYNNYGERLSARFQEPALWWNVAAACAVAAIAMGSSINRDST
jgi:hypothetical protein